MKNILYINGSPRGETESNSAQILKDLTGFLKEEGVTNGDVSLLTLPRKIIGPPEPLLEKLGEFDIWILSLPLYVDSLPGHLCRWLYLFQSFRNTQDTPRRIQVYGIINCGFPEAVQNRDALSILEMYCRQTGMDWRLGIGIGMGEAYTQMSGMPLRSPGKSEILKAFQILAGDLKSGSGPEGAQVFACVKFPRLAYTLMGSFGWIQQARKNGLKRKDLYARPFL